MKKSVSQTPEQSGIDCAAIISERDRGPAYAAKRYTCSCGGIAFCVSATELADRFACEKCKDVAVVIRPPKKPELIHDSSRVLEY